MNIPKLLEDLAIISKLGDNPGSDNGLSTSAFRAKFDEAALVIQNYINNILIPAINPLNSPESGLSMTGGIEMNGWPLRGLRSPTKGNDAVTKQYADGKESKKLIFSGKVIPAASFVVDADGTHENYPLCASVALEDVTYSMIPEVIFGLADATNGNFAPVTECYDGGIKIYATEVPETDVTVPTIIFWEGA